jgi:hypothetical protein
VAKQPKYDGIQPDRKNANKGTERGRYMVEASLRETGAGRSILLDKDGRIIAGNKTFEAASDIGLPVRVVETDGTELVAVKRTDLDLDDDTGTARKLAYFDNRTSSVGLAWDVEQILADVNAGLDLSGLWFEQELDGLLGTLTEGDNFDPAQEWQGMPEFKNEDVMTRQLRIYFATQKDVDAFAKLIGQKITDKTTFVWYPEQERVDMKNYKVVDES